jgi:hypothetical protein
MNEFVGMCDIIPEVKQQLKLVGTGRSKHYWYNNTQRNSELYMRCSLKIQYYLNKTFPFAAALSDDLKDAASPIRVRNLLSSYQANCAYTEASTHSQNAFEFYYSFVYKVGSNRSL